MRKFIASFNGEQVATMVDHPDMGFTIAALVMEWIRLGWEVGYQDNETPIPSTPEAHQAETQKRRIKHHQQEALPAGETSGRVYLKWQALSEDQKRELSIYRNKQGIVIEKKPAVGTAVRFNNDPELIWLPGRCLATYPDE